MNILPTRKRLFLAKAAMAVALLAALYALADWRSVVHAMGGLNPWYLAAALVLFIPQTLVSALRWRYLMSPFVGISLAESTRQTLAASAVNLFVPSKLGDFSKAVMLPVSSQLRTWAARWVLVEKLSDVAALVAFLVVGTLYVFVGGLAAGIVAACIVLLAVRQATHHHGASALAGRAGFCALWSIGLWSLHLLQIHLFLLAAGVDVALLVTAARVPMAIFAGLLPITLWGLGTRDAALVWLFADHAPAAVMVTVGVLTALRYFLPGLAGIFYLPGFLPARAAARWISPTARSAAD